MRWKGNHWSTKQHLAEEGLPTRGFSDLYKGKSRKNWQVVVREENRDFHFFSLFYVKFQQFIIFVLHKQKVKDKGTSKG